MSEFGHATEELIENICKKMFLAEFTVRSPNYKKLDGQEKEAADILVPFHEALIAFQVKSFKPTKEIADEAVWSARAEKKIEEGIQQIRTIRSAVKNDLIASLTTARGVTLPFKCGDIKRIVGVVVVEVFGDAEKPRNEQSWLIHGFEQLEDIPVHIFTRSEFEAIATEIDTVPDFLKYLDDRAVLRGQNRINPYSEELDFLALYKTDFETVQKSVSTGSPILTLDSGIWEQFKSNQTAQKRREELNRPSYLIDKLIDTLHSSIGFKDPAMEAFDMPLAHAPGTVESYKAAILELAALPRLLRRTFGQRMLDALDRSTRQPFAYALGGIDPDPMKLEQGQFSSAVLFLAFNGDRKKRIDRLQEIAASAYCAFGLKRIFGIATEAGHPNGRSFDFAIMIDVSFENHEELKGRGLELFPKREHIRTHEWR